MKNFYASLRPVSALAARPAVAFTVAAALVNILAASNLAGAATTDISNVPLSNTKTAEAKPNLLFMLDDSGSMGWTHMPDAAVDFLTDAGYKSSFCNLVYYNPDVKYVPPLNADGSSFTNAPFTAAPNNGFFSTSGTSNLSTEFRAYDNATSAGNGSDAAQAAYYFKYTGTATVPNYTNTNSTFYKACNDNTSAAPFTKVLVTAASGTNLLVGADERQNFANWYTYYRTRMQLMKSGVGTAFASVTDKIRAGFVTINTGTYDDSNSKFLTIRDFDAAQKATWYQKLYGIVPNNSTPLREALSKAGRLFAGKLGPDPVQYSCQQNYTLLSTDGFWNGNGGKQLDGSTDIGNEDNAAGTAPRPKFDGALAGASGTLADVAQYYYRTDLRPASGTCNTGASGADVCKDNVPSAKYETVQPAPHQHMTTYTLGLGVDGTLGYNTDYADKIDSSPDYEAIKGGSKNWPVPSANQLTAVDDLWHAAVNGGGKYLSAKSVDSLVSGVRGLVKDAQIKTGAAAAAATSTLEPVSGDNLAFTASYRTTTWDGDVEARTIDVLTGALNETVEWSARDKLQTKITTPSSDTRAIYTFSSSTANKLRAFLPANFSTAEKTSWFNPTTLSQYLSLTPAEKLNATSDNFINYLRGHSQYEDEPTNTNSKIFRDRAYVLGDVVNGRPSYVGSPPFSYSDAGYASFKAAQASRAPTLYVAANDGMLHAFEATTGSVSSGSERWAYMPQLVIADIWRTADNTYPGAHRFYTDGAPVVGDIYDGTNWRTILVAGLNAGGNGYYALDITNPNAPIALWEFTHAKMGNTYGNPIIAKLANGNWRVMFTSGYNNPGGTGVLYVVDPITGVLDFSIETGVGSSGSPSGLAKINGWVENAIQDNTVTRIYGGDLEGNLWRFDINDLYGAAGKDAFNLAKLRVSGNNQPITTKPELGLVSDKPVVYVGTGRYLGISDVASGSQQSLYAIKDQLNTTSYTNLRSGGSCPFIEQTISIINAAERTLSANPVDFTSNCGWYVDFNPSNQSSGERVTVDPVLQLGVLAVVTNVPTADQCDAGGYSFVYFFDFKTGSFVPSTISSTYTGGLAGQQVANAQVVGVNVYRLPDGKVVATLTTSDDQRKTYGVPEASGVGGGGKRVSWRELLE